MAYRNTKATIPTIEDFVMAVMGLSEALYDGAWTIGYAAYDVERPKDWPSSKYVLKFYGYTPDFSGWHTMVDFHIGIDVKSIQEIRAEQGEARWRKRWKLDEKPDYTAQPNEQYLAAMYMDGIYGFGRVK